MFRRLAELIQSLYRLLIELTNGKWSSMILRRFATSSASRFLIPVFAKNYRINLNEMEKSINEFPTLHDFFVRTLKPGLRDVDPDTKTVVSPVDAVIEDVGMIESTNEITVKGKTYSIKEMLGKEETLEKYVGGQYIILYLSPSHYHRIHSPITGRVVGQWTLGEKSYPVNRLGLKYGRDTLSKNYRRITEVKHDGGHLAIVKVGAMFVNSIELIHKGEELTKGEEMAYFTFGSTVVLLFEKETFSSDSFQTPKDIKVGERIGMLRG